MTRMMAVIISVVPVLIAIAGCGVRGPAGTGAVSPGGSAAVAKPSVYSAIQAIPAGGPNPQAAVPNPGTGTGDPLLVRALLPQAASGRAAVFLLPPAVVALPDRDRGSMFIGLRQYSSPVSGPRVCDGWTAGLWVLAVTSFNRPGVQLAVTEQSAPTPAGLPMFSEAIITGPSSVLNAMISPLPPDCRVITGRPDSGGVRPIGASAPVPGSVHAEAFEVTGTGKFPVWQWAEVVRGPGFLLEIRIPNQSGDADPGAALARITASAYSRAVAALSLSLLCNRRCAAMRPRGMRSQMRRGPGTMLLLATCAVMALPGCAAAHTTTVRDSGASRTTVSRTRVSPTPRERAVADAAAILAAFATPPGAQRLSKAPDALKVASSSLVSSTLVDDVSFWLVPGRPQTVLAWEQAHLARRFAAEDAGSGPQSWFREFSLSPIPGVLNGRDLVVEVAGAGNGQTAIRVDAQVSWQPPRPAGERVPSGARVATIAELPSLGPHASRPPTPVTITGLAVVRQLAVLVDNLRLSTIGAASCPAFFGGGIRLTFLVTPGGPPLAVAQAPATCGTVQFSVGGKPQPALQITDSFIAQVLSLAGVHWKVP